MGVKYNGPGIDVNVAAFLPALFELPAQHLQRRQFEVTNIQACKDSLGGADVDGLAATGGCAANRLKPGVTSKGFEIEAFLKPARYFTVNMGLTYAKTEYARDLVGTIGRPLSPVLFQLPGGAVSNAPEYVVTAGMSWTPPIGDSGLTALFYLNSRLQSDTNTGSDLDLEKIQDAFVVVNGRVGIQARTSAGAWNCGGRTCSTSSTSWSALTCHCRAVALTARRRQRPRPGWPALPTSCCRLPRRTAHLRHHGALQLLIQRGGGPGSDPRPAALWAHVLRPITARANWATPRGIKA